MEKLYLEPESAARFLMRWRRYADPNHFPSFKVARSSPCALQDLVGSLDPQRSKVLIGILTQKIEAMRERLSVVHNEVGREGGGGVIPWDLWEKNPEAVAEFMIRDFARMEIHLECCRDMVRVWTAVMASITKQTDFYRYFTHRPSSETLSGAIVDCCKSDGFHYAEMVKKEYFLRAYTCYCFFPVAGDLPSAPEEADVLRSMEELPECVAKAIESPATNVEKKNSDQSRPLLWRRWRELPNSLPGPPAAGGGSDVLAMNRQQPNLAENQKPGGKVWAVRVEARERFGAAFAALKRVEQALIVGYLVNDKKTAGPRRNMAKEIMCVPEAKGGEALGEPICEVNSSRFYEQLFVSPRFQFVRYGEGFAPAINALIAAKGGSEEASLISRYFSGATSQALGGLGEAAQHLCLGLESMLVPIADVLNKDANDKQKIEIGFSRIPRVGAALMALNAQVWCSEEFAAFCGRGVRCGLEKVVAAEIGSVAGFGGYFRAEVEELAEVVALRHVLAHQGRNEFRREHVGVLLRLWRFVLNFRWSLARAQRRLAPIGRPDKNAGFDELFGLVGALMLLDAMDLEQQRQTVVVGGWQNKYSRCSGWANWSDDLNAFRQIIESKEANVKSLELRRSELRKWLSGGSG